MRIDEHAAGPSLRTRWLAGIAGLVLCPISGAITVFYLVVPILLISGAVMAGRWPAAGKYLMGMSAVLLSALVLPWCVAITLHPGGLMDLLLLDCIISVILLPICDVALIIDVVKRHRIPKG